MARPRRCKQESDPFGSCAADGDWESTRFFPLAGDGFGPEFGVGPFGRTRTRYQENRSVRRLKNARNRKFESISLQQRDGMGQAARKWHHRRCSQLIECPDAPAER